MNGVSLLAFLGMMIIVTWMVLRHMKERDQILEQDRKDYDAFLESEGYCPKHGKPWCITDDFSRRYCMFYDPDLGASEDYECPQAIE